MILGDELERGLLADTRNTGDVVRGVAHQRLDIDKLLRRDTVFLKKLCTVEDDGFLVGCQKDSDIVADELQCIAVARQKICLIAVVDCLCRKGTEDIVGFVSGLLRNGEAHCRGTFLCVRELHAQFIRGGVAACLIFGIRLVAEGRLFAVKCDDADVGLDCVQLFFQHGDHTVDRVGVDAVLGGQRTDAVIGAVDDAVAVNNE